MTSKDAQISHYWARIQELEARNERLQAKCGELAMALAKSNETIARLLGEDAPK
jgi:peptidoglycan hydrolase CwlO-like protein